MNSIDKTFYKEVKEIESLFKEELFLKIKTSYNVLSKEIKNSLENYFSTFDYWGRLNEKQSVYEEIQNRTDSLFHHIQDFVWLYEHLQDYRSKKVLLAILTNYYKYDFTTLFECRENNFLPYFDVDIVKCSNQEIIVDLGAYTGDTIIDYLTTYGTETYKKIICYEITENTFTTLQNNLSYYQNIDCRRKGISNKKEMLYIDNNNLDASANTLINHGTNEVEVTTIDEDIYEPVTMIKMDIEGSEQKAIEGASKTIQKYHPKLLISVYHNHEDIWKIPKMIEQIAPGYKFYLRYYGNNIFPTETTLIAIYE